MSEKGHNSGLNKEEQGSLKDFIERIERHMEEKRAIQEDIKSLFDEAKGKGFDPKIMRKVIKLRYQDHAAVSAEQEMIDIYCHALGMLPLFEAAHEAETKTAKSKKAA